MSIDGYLANATEKRLLLSNDADFDRVDAVRASCDAILVGAATVRNDNPRLLVRSRVRRAQRAARGLPASPMKVTVTRRAELDARAAFFTAGDAEKIVYCASPRVGDARARLGPVATVVDGGHTVEMRKLTTDLAARGVERLMVEGGGKVHTQFLTDDLVDELHLVVAGRIRQGAPAFLVTLALVLPLTIVFARGFAAVFEAPFRRHRSWASLRGRPDRSVVPEPRREGVAQQHHVADLADVGELRPLAGVPGELAVAHESGRL